MLLLQDIILGSDWWIHILSSFFLWGLLYLIEVRWLKRKFKSKNVLLQILLSNLIDLDHLFSASIFESGRCSINNHPLHSVVVFPVYILGLFTRYRYFVLGIFMHLFIDYLGCIL